MSKLVSDDRSTFTKVDKTRKQTILLATSDSSKLWNMLKEDGYNLTLRESDHFDAVIFSGIAPISPMYYGEPPCFGLHSMQPSFTRDRREWRLLHKLPRSVPKIGLGRGAHLLNAFCGGNSLQDVSGHAGIQSGTHKILFPAMNETVEVASNHFQMMVPALDATVLAYAQKSYFKKSHMFQRIYKRDERNETWDDAEVILYWYNNCLCFEPLAYETTPWCETEALFLMMLEQFIAGSLE